MTARWVALGQASVAPRLREVHRLLAKTPAAPAFRGRVAQRVRGRLFEMRPGDVVTVMGALEAAGVRAWVAGGWGVDALLGRQTRHHRDLDVVLDADDGAELKATAALGGLGYRPADLRAPAGKWMPEKVVLRDRCGRTVDLLPATVSTTPPRGEGFSYPPDAFSRGAVGGRPVACLSASVQLTFHEDYEPRALDRHDVALLCRQFGLTLPQSYA